MEMVSSGNVTDGCFINLLAFINSEHVKTRIGVSASGCIGEPEDGVGESVCGREDAYRRIGVSAYRRVDVSANLETVSAYRRARRRKTRIGESEQGRASAGSPDGSCRDITSKNARRH